MSHWGLFLYLGSLLIQAVSVFFVLHLFMRVRLYKFSYACLMLTLALMMFERVEPLIECCIFGSFNTLNVVVSSLVSIALLLSILGIRKGLLEAEKHRDMLERLSKLDYLTGVASRFEIERRTEDELQRSFRTKHATSLLMVDIDHFKVVNDSYGHSAGDRVLRSLAHISLMTLRETDLIGRVGGEEFLVLLPETDSTEAFQVAERLRLAVASHVCTHHMGSEIKIQISIGVSTYHPEKIFGIDAHKLMRGFIKSTDEAMYKAKAAGRNQTCCCIDYVLGDSDVS